MSSFQKIIEQGIFMVYKYAFPFMRANFTSCATRTTRKAPFWQLCSQFQSAANEMLFYQLHHLYESYTWQDPPDDNFAQ